MITQPISVEKKSPLESLLPIIQIVGGLMTGNASGVMTAIGGGASLLGKKGSSADNAGGVGDGGDSRTAMTRRIDAIQGTGSTNAVDRIRDAQEALKMANLDAQTKELIALKLDRAKQIGA